jgi:hypothetical protein
MKVRVDEYFAQLFMKQNAKTRKCIVNWDFVAFSSISNNWKCEREQEEIYFCLLMILACKTKL